MARKFERYRPEDDSDLLTVDPGQAPDDEFEAVLRSMELDLEQLDSMHRPERHNPASPSESLPPIPASWLVLAPASDSIDPEPRRSPRPVRKTAFRTPWEIHSFRELFSFFGPMLTILAAAQLYSAWMLSRIAATSDFKWLDLGGVRLAGIIALAFLACDAVYLRIHFGKENTLVMPWVLGLAGGSYVFALSCHVAVHYF